MEFRDCVMKGGKTLSIFAFSSVKALSQYTVEEILEMGIDGFWIGYEGDALRLRQAARPPGSGHHHGVSRSRHHDSDLDDRRIRLSE